LDGEKFKMAWTVIFLWWSSENFRWRMGKHKLNENRGKFINFAKIGWGIYTFCGNREGNKQYASLA